jgi:hypothetical protein
MTSVKWGTPEAPHVALQVTTALANNGRQLGGAITPSGYVYSSWEFNAQFHVSPSANSSIELYLVPTIDGSNYSSGAEAVDAPLTTLVGAFPLYPNANSGMRIPLMNLLTVPMSFKPLIKNLSGQTIPANSGTLTVRFYNEDIV